MGYKLKEARVHARMTQEELAKASGVSRVTISQIEQGKATDVLFGTLKKLASALNVPIDEIFFDESA